MVTFFVRGHPRTKGSLQPFLAKSGKVGLRESNDFFLRQWRGQVKDGAVAAMVAAGRAQFTASVYLGVTFYFAPGTPIFGQNRYDTDKLVRAVMDALTDARAYRDDSQVTELHAKKCIMAPDGHAGVAICIDVASAVPP